MNKLIEFRMQKAKESRFSAVKFFFVHYHFRTIEIKNSGKAVIIKIYLWDMGRIWETD